MNRTATSCSEKKVIFGIRVGNVHWVIRELGNPLKAGCAESAVDIYLHLIGDLGLDETVLIEGDKNTEEKGTKKVPNSYNHT